MGFSYIGKMAYLYRARPQVINSHVNEYAE